MRHLARKVKHNWRKITGRLLFAILLLSMGQIIYNMVMAPSSLASPDAEGLVKSDYSLMLIQSILGLVVMFIPSMIERRWSIGIPNHMYLLYYAFLFCAIYLGEVWNFYFLIPFWDLILHALSGAMLGALGFSLVTMLNDAEWIKLHLSPIFVALFAFCFAVAAGTVWEIYEFAVDSILGLNMQKFMLEDGTVLTGAAALSDTMTDLIIDAISALVISILGFFTIKKRESVYMNNGRSVDKKPESASLTN